MKSEVIERAKEIREGTHPGPMRPCLFLYIEGQLAAVLIHQTDDADDLFSSIPLCRHVVKADYIVLVQDARIRYPEGHPDVVVLTSTEDEIQLLSYQPDGDSIKWLPDPKIKFFGGRVPDALKASFNSPEPERIDSLLKMVVRDLGPDEGRKATIRAVCHVLSETFEVLIAAEGPLC